jgi:hypothetical protein
MPEKKTTSVIPLPIEWEIPENFPVRYATHLVVQVMENEFLISFFEIHPPIVLGKPDEIVEQLTKFQSIKANCVAQILVSAQKMPEIINALEQVVKQTTDQKDDVEA